MKHVVLSRRAVCVILLMAGAISMHAAKAADTATDAKSTSGTTLYSNDFEKLPEGPLPEDFLVTSGEFAVKIVDGNHVLQLPGQPLDTMGVMFGPVQKENISVQAKVLTTGKKRIRPQFGVGLNGQRGFKLYVVGNKDTLDLYKNDELLASVPYKWKSGSWTHFKLQLRKVAEKEWRADGKVWIEGEKEPDAWMIGADEKKSAGSGRALVLGMPYAENPINYDNLDLQKLPGDAAKPAEAKPANP